MKDRHDRPDDRLEARCRPEPAIPDVERREERRPEEGVEVRENGVPRRAPEEQRVGGDWKKEGDRCQNPGEGGSPRVPASCGDDEEATKDDDTDGRGENEVRELEGHRRPEEDADERQVVEQVPSLLLAGEDEETRLEEERQAVEINHVVADFPQDSLG